ncbi:MAG: ATP-binding cassette domain-containing protein [Actinobacteria bacterium]|nr:ATP-binding cassette domain-containing protein [Actinomycetota bacterium]
MTVADMDTQKLHALDGPALLECKSVEVAYDGVQVLFGVDLVVGQGEIIALLGTNGAGKSTLLKAISGLVDPIGGSIHFHGRDITHAGAVETAKLGIVQVPGGKAVFPTLSVEEHFKVGSWLLDGEDKSAQDERRAQVLKRFPRLVERWGQMAGNLSGGEQQQLALAMAFVAHPKLLMIDELSLGLAPSIVEQLLELVFTIHDEGTTIVLVEQSVNVALMLAERAVFMEKGEVRFSGPTSELLERDDVLRSVFLEGASATLHGSKQASPAPSSDGSPAATATELDATRASTPQRSIPAETAAFPSAVMATDALAREGFSANPVVLEVSGLTKHFGGVLAVSDVGFSLRAGEILGLIGPNGAGKTTIFDMISGLVPTDGGRVMLLGLDVTKWGPDRRASAGLARSFQDARIFPSLTVSDNIALGLDRHIAVRDHLSSLLYLPAIQESERDVAFTVEQLIELLNLQAYRDKFVSELSTGSRRIVDLAMAIAHDPKVLILDEPSSGIAQRETEALGPLLKRIQTETGCAMLVIEHDMPLITSISDQMLALDLGRVVVQGTPQEVVNDPRVVASYLGGDTAATRRSGNLAGPSSPTETEEPTGKLPVPDSISPAAVTEQLPLVGNRQPDTEPIRGRGAS